MRGLGVCCGTIVDSTPHMCMCSCMCGCAGTGTAFMQLQAVVSKGLQPRSRHRRNQKTTGADAKTRTQVSTSLQASTFRSQLMHTPFRRDITCGGWRTRHQHCVVPPCDQPHRAIQRRGPASVQPKQPCETASCSTPSRSPHTADTTFVMRRSDVSTSFCTARLRCTCFSCAWRMTSWKHVTSPRCVRVTPRWEAGGVGCTGNHAQESGRT